MQIFRDCAAATLLASALMLPVESLADSLSVRTGIGYDFMSQEYFLDTAILIDTLESKLELKTDYLDDLKGILDLTYFPYADRRMELGSSYRQTEEDSRLRLEGNLTTRSGGVRFDLRSELDWREHIGDSADAGDSYLVGSSQAALRVPVGRSTSLWWKARGEFVRFDSTSGYSQNYHRLGAKMGILQDIASMSMLDLSLFVLHRQVLDSNFLNYLSAGFEGGLFGFYEKGELDAFVRLEVKDYNKPGSEDDYWHVEVDARHKLRHSERWFSRQYLEFETATFSEQDIANFDYTRVGLSLLGGYEEGWLSLSAGPDLELLSEKNTEDIEGQDYFETGLRVDLDYLLPGKTFVSFQSQTGFRNLEKESSFQSDFSFERLNLLSDWTIIGGLNLNVMLSAEWEWHENSEENNRLVLLSSGLTCNF